MKLYVNTTGELVIDDGNQKKKFPAFYGIGRTYTNGDDSLILKNLASGEGILGETVYSDIQDEAGDDYADMAAVNTEIDPYFDDVV